MRWNPIALVAGLALSLPVLPAAAPPEKTGAELTAPFENGWFRLWLPRGWSRNPKGSCGWLAGATCDVFEGPGGEFLQIIVDPPETELPPVDAWWKLGRQGGGRGIRVAERGKRCTEELARCRKEQGEDAETFCGCGAGDGKLTLAARGPAVLEGHDLFFWFGHAKREDGVSLEAFAAILETFEAKPPPYPGAKAKDQ